MTNPITAAPPAGEDTILVQHEKLLRETPTYSAVWRALDAISGEMAISVTVHTTTATVVFRQKYGNTKGIRTVMLIRPDAESAWELKLNLFAPTTTSTDPVRRVSAPVAPARPAPANVLTLQVPEFYRLLDGSGKIIADNLASRLWAQRMAASLQEFGPITMHTYRGSQRIIHDSDIDSDSDAS